MQSGQVKRNQGKGEPSAPAEKRNKKPGIG